MSPAGYRFTADGAAAFAAILGQPRTAFLEGMVTMDTNPLRLEYVDPSTLGPNPLNWRTHGPDQRATFAALLQEVGWSDVLRFNEATGRLIDGHMRREEAIRLGLGAIPVLMGRWTEAQERKILATADTLGMLAGADAVAWAELLKGIDTGSTELQELLSGCSEAFGAIPGDDQAGPGDDQSEDDTDFELADEDEGIAAAPDVVYPSDNEWGVPSLDPAMQADAPQFPMTVWGSVGRKKSMPGTWLFYTADRRFDRVFADPVAILDSLPAYAVEPNYSTHAQMPRAFVLWGIYRKRWVNRFWQTRGLKTFVDLNVNEEFQPLNLLGVPRGWRAFATRSHSDGRFIEAEFEAAAGHAGTDDLVFLVYGGGEPVRRLCADRRWFWCPEQSDSARNRKGKS